MASFCSRCGTPLLPNTAFCPSCGNPAGAGAVTPVAPPAPATPALSGYPEANAGGAPPPVAGYPSPAAYRTQSSGGATKIILIVVAVVVGLGMLTLGGIGLTAWRVSRAFHANNKGDGVTVSLPGGGTVSAGNSIVSEGDLGVPEYPGSTREKGGMEMSSSAASIVMAHYTTGDSVSQVVDFYKSKMGEGAVVVSTGNGTVLNSGENDKNRIMVTVGSGSGDDAGKTTIVIMHSKKG